MIGGIMADSNIIFSPETINYLNYVQQQVTTLASESGSSGAPVIYYDPQLQKGVVCGMVQWVKKENTYTGGLNSYSCVRIYKKIIKLNIKKSKITDTRLMFNGNNGKGFIGVRNYAYVNATILTLMCKNFPLFKKSHWYNSVQGIIVIQYTTDNIILPNSRLPNAVNINKKSYLQQLTRTKKSNKRISLGDILLEFNQTQLGDTENSSRLSDFPYYNAGKP